jgi:tetratricopeptide (TPR) repeat protein
VGVQDRAVRYWLKDEHLPPETETIERLLFANDARCGDWRMELRNAHAAQSAAGGGGRSLAQVARAGRTLAAANIPVRVPRHFLGRGEAMTAIEEAFAQGGDRVAIAVLHGLRGVGKTTLAAAYAERHRGDYRAMWWLRAQTEPTLRADLVGLGVRLGWVAADEKEERALNAVMERLLHDGEDILLIYDNAIDAASLKPYLPRRGAARALVTSNAHAWREIATPLKIDLWPKDIGADYLIARTGREKERRAALALSEALGGLPLAHEQAAAYCERLEISLSDYRKRFEEAPIKRLDDKAPDEYHGGLTVSKTFTLAIEEAAKLHPAAEALIVYAALLAAEPIPLFFFSAGREKFGEPLASALEEDGLDEAVAALRAFGLVERVTIEDERDPTIATDAIRLHRLVRRVAAARMEGQARDQALRTLLEAMAAVYPEEEVLNNPTTWPWARCLDALALALALVGDDTNRLSGVEKSRASLLNRLAAFRHGALAAYAQARPLCERALAIREKVLDPEHPDTATSLDNLAGLLRAQGDLAGARPLCERALAIHEKVLDPEHPETAASLDNFAGLLKDQGDLAGARPLHERALAIREKALGPEHPDTANSLNNLAGLLKDQGDLAGARPLYERALAIYEEALGPEHPATATSLNNLACLLQAQGDLAGARPLFERALAIREKVLGPEHPATATSLNNLACLLQAQGDLAGARPLYERALAICEKALGPEHPDTARGLGTLAGLLQAQGDLAGARPLYERALAICEKALGPEHPDTARGLGTLAGLLQAQGDLAGARPLYERALAIREKALGPEHPATATSLNNLACLLQAQGDLAGARPLFERALAIKEKVLGLEHPDTATSLDNLACLLQAQGVLAGARPLCERALAIRENVLGPEHPDTATNLSNLACLLQAQGDLAGARPLCERALAICEKALGPEHPATATNLSNLARLLRDTGHAVEAEPLFRRAIAIGEKALGLEHPLTRRYQSHYARLLLNTNRLAQALALGKAALVTHEAASGPEHPWTKDSARVTADALGDVEEAAALRARYGLSDAGAQR